MSWQATSWAARQTAGNSGRKALLLLIANAADPTGVTFVGRETLAEECECRPETVSVNLGALEAAGLLIRIQRRRRNGSRTTDWIVLAPGCEDRGEMRDGDVDQLPTAVATEARKSHGEESSGEDFSHKENGSGQVRFSGSPEQVSEQEQERESSARAGAICDRLLTHVRAVDPDAEVPSPEWLPAAEQLLERSGGLTEVLEVLDWAATDTFWRGLVLSPMDLDRHYTRIIGVRGRGTSPTGGTSSQRSDMDRRADRLAKLATDAGTCTAAAGAAPSRAEERWAQLAPAVRQAVGEQNFELWLGAAHAHVGGDDELLLAVPETTWGFVRDRFGPVLAKAAGHRIEVVVCQEAT